MDKNHSSAHSSNAFCGNAGPEEMEHLYDLTSQLTDTELKNLVHSVGITFDIDESDLDRDAYESVIDEADREIFYKEYRNIINSRQNKK